jgi:acyl transferase domain-containing protein
LEQGAGELCARLSVPLSVQGEWQQYGLHPSLLDGALQACVGLLQEQSRAAQPWVPYAVEQVRAVRACAQQMWVWARWTAGGEGRSLDVELCDEQGAVCVQLRGFTARPLVAQSVQPVPAVEAPVGLLLARPVWRSSEALGGGEVYERRLVLLCELTQVQAQRLEGLLPGSECRELSAQGDVAQRYGEQAVQCFEQLREVLRSKPRGKVLVQVVAGQSERGGFSAGLTGLLRTAQQENPQLVGQVVMVEEGISEAQLAQRLSREPGAQVAAQVRYRGGEREVCGWQEEVLGGEGLPLVWKERGIYVLSGGLGGLGMLLARQVLSQTTQGQVVLVGRGELTESKRQQLAGLWPTAGRVHYRQADVADAQQVRELLEGVCREHGGLDGIVHGAGVKADNFIVKKTSEEFREVLRAKVQGVCNLDQASRALELDFLVLFSSVAGALGNVGQADYAAGNGFLDRYAEYRNELVRRGERHGRTVSINWPLWAEGGMQMEAASLEWLQRETGMRPLETPAGLQALQRALQLSAGQVLVLEGERERLRAALGLVRPAPALAAVAALAAVPAASSAAVSEPVSGNELLERTQEYLREQLAGQLHLAAHRIDPQAPLEQYGIDSILAMNLTRELERSFGTLSKTLFFEYRSVRELAGYFLQSHEARLRSLVMRPPAGEAPAGEVPVPVSVAQRAGRRRAGRGQGRVPESAAVAEPIAIIGLSGRYPQALNVQQYWENLKAGKDCITEVPAQRWDWREYYSEDRSREGSHYSKWGGFIEGVDEFDPLFFNISPREAQALDPQERIFLQHAWMAVEDAGYTRQSLQIAQEQDLAGQVGVYVGVMYSEYQLYGAEAGVRGQRTAIAGSFASIANRVSYVLNLHGPSMTLDTMCSSSLTAIHVACQDLRLKRTQVAIAGGVNVSIHPAKYLMLSAGQFISSAGQCQSFGEGGDGYIPGEGAGAVVLKRLSQAQRDGDHTAARRTVTRCPIRRRRAARSAGRCARRRSMRGTSATSRRTARGRSLGIRSRLRR